MAGLLGLPFPNGLIPQAPFHTESLCVTQMVPDEDERGDSKGHFTLKATHVVEQRASNLAQGLLTLGTMTGPLLLILHLIPQGVLAGLFFVMGVQALEANGITAKLVFLCRDASLTPGGHPLRRIARRGAVWAFVAIELLGFGATFAITQTVAAVGFPVFILLLIPVRALLLPRMFTPQELSVLYEPTASPFTMESVGGSYGGAVVIDAGPGSGDDGDNGSNSKALGNSPLFVGSDDNTAMASETPSIKLDRDAAGFTARSKEDLAELGESRNALSSTVTGSETTRRLGTSRREQRNGGSEIQMQRVSMSRRGQSSRTRS